MYSVIRRLVDACRGPSGLVVWYQRPAYHRDKSHILHHVVSAHHAAPVVRVDCKDLNTHLDIVAALTAPGLCSYGCIDRVLLPPAARRTLLILDNAHTDMLGDIPLTAHMTMDRFVVLFITDDCRLARRVKASPHIVSSVYIQ